MRRLPAVASLVLALAACSPYSPDLPDEPFLCGSGAQPCPDGFTCQTATKICTKSGGGDGPDGGPNVGSCSDDSKLEPNDSITDAFQTTVATSRASIDLTELAICPAGDVDTYAFTITVEQQNATASVMYDAVGTPLQMTMLNSSAGGTVIATAAGSGTDTIGVSVPNLSTGTFYIQVSAATAGGTNPTYSLSLAVTGP